MDRRGFLRRAGLVTGGAAAGAGATTGYAVYHERTDTEISGHAVGTFKPPNITSTSITYRVRTTKPMIALTLDDGPSAKYTERVLDILEQKKVTATFNLIGKHAKAFPELAQWAAKSHEIGNHTWSHPNMSLYGAQSARDQLRRGADAITAATGVTPRLWRPPYGYFSGATIMMAASFGYPIVLWDTRFLQHGQNVKTNLDSLGSSVTAGSIILGHDGGTLNCEVVVAALPDLIDNLRGKGLEFVTTSTLLANDTGHDPPVVKTASR